MNNLRMIRRLKDLTQYQLSQKTNIPQSVISLIERDYKDPSQEARMMLAEVLNCEVEEVFPETKK